MAEDVVDICFGCRWVSEIQVPVGVRGADDPVTAPRNDEQHRFLGTQDDGGFTDDAIARDDDVYALRRSHPEPSALT